MRKSILFFLLCLVSFSTEARVRLPRLISDGMVLQRNADIRIWGWAAANERVEVGFQGKVYEATADENGSWSVELSGLKAGGPHRMDIRASNYITIKDILIGDVWVCSGQSQMDISMERVSPLYEDEIKKAGNPNIRYFQVPTVYDFNRPRQDLQEGKWKSVGQDNILSISAIAWFFAEELYRTYQVPIGIIRSSLGGSPAEAWISEDALREFPEHYREAQKFKDSTLIEQIEQTAREETAAWYRTLNETDEGYKDPGMPWYKPQTDVSGWPLMKVPGYWANGELGAVNGVVWFRKDIDLPADMAGKPARLNLGRLVDADSVFVNGVFVGSVGYQYPPRRYEIPEGLLKAGENTLVVRLISQNGEGGFVPDKPYELLIEDHKIDLKGDWHYHLGAKMPPMPAHPVVRWKPAGLFNGMIAPLTHLAIKGVIWYQGESNTGRPREYRKLFPALINNWRDKWGQGDFPFLYVQLHNYLEPLDHPTESYWALTREAQAQALSLPNTGMAVAIDLGEWNDVHPLNKKDVAKRLALVALKTAYHEPGIVYSGPQFQSMKIQGGKIILSFTHTGGGLIVKGGGGLKHFAISGKDRQFVWAKARIDGDKVIVWNEAIKHPVAVRYAWADNPEGANLYNAEGLPAAPSRTDDW